MILLEQVDDEKKLVLIDTNKDFFDSGQKILESRIESNEVGLKSICFKKLFEPAITKEFEEIIKKDNLEKKIKISFEKKQNEIQMNLTGAKIALEKLE